MHRPTSMALVATCGLLALNNAAWAADLSALAPIVVTPTDNAASIALQTDQQLIVKLPMQLGTGFSWRVDPKSARILAALKPSENSTESPPGAVSQPGAPEIQVLTFRAMMEGRGTLKLIYNQPWRVGVPPSKVFLLHITVHGARAAD